MAVRIRNAGAPDQPAINSIVRRAGINPIGLHWSKFLVAEDEGGHVISVGQVKSHGDGSRELASIAVSPGRRGEGIASALVEALLAREASDLYLMCASDLETFYERFGFRRVGQDEMPPYFRRIVRLARVVQATASLLGDQRTIIVMQRPAPG